MTDGCCVRVSSPLAGLMMGTRSGDIDPSIVSFLAQQEGQTPDKVTYIRLKCVSPQLLSYVISGRTSSHRLGQLLLASAPSMIAHGSRVFLVLRRRNASVLLPMCYFSMCYFLGVTSYVLLPMCYFLCVTSASAIA